MMDLLNQFESKIQKLIDIKADDFSKIYAGLNDIIEGISEIKENISKINSTQNIEEIHENLINIQIELVNHIKPHISEMEKPLMTVVNQLEEKY